MTWQRDLRLADTPSTDTYIELVDILYEFDTPQLFTAKIGISRQLVYKLDEVDGVYQYLTCDSSPEAIGALRAGRLSVRGALESDRYRIIETNDQMLVRYVWPLLAGDLPDDFLPARNHALFDYFGPVPDCIEQANTFFSVKFAGAQLHRETISLRSFKQMTDTFYVLVDKIFTPALLENRRRKGLIDYDLYEPKVASLLLSIKSPSVNEDKIRRRTDIEDSKLGDSITEEMSKNRDAFFSSVEGLVAKASIGSLDAVVRRQEFEWLDIIADLVPSTDGTYETVELNATTPAGLETVIIGQTAGDRIKEAHRIASSEPLVLNGVVVEVNSPSSTFILRTATYRQTTCVFPEEMFRRLERQQLIRVGAKVAVLGNFERRTRRDRLFVTDEPRFD